MDLSNQISEAEWQIMRTVWTNVPATSTGIINELKDSTGWMPTTVKTMLSRLVKKGVLSYQTKGRTHYYYPLMSEEECIRNEMHAFIDKVYGGQLIMETEHFKFRGDKDFEYIYQLSIALEESYERIVRDLNHTLREKCLVYTHVTQKRLHSALGVLDGPQWLRSGYAWGILHIAPHKCFDDILAEKAAVHTFTQVLINQINPSAPYWLQQAISSYESKWLSKERIAEAVKSYSTASDLSTMKDMSKVYVTFKEAGGYEVSYTVAEYIDRTFGMVALEKLLREPTDFQGIINLSEHEFWSGWNRYLRENYL
jgi:predicted transcriptional regulator